ncbi:LacI family DNA-binding transcriptional regulator [Streptomyces oceani]|uniref:LacI family transcriptional regulator n=1 Tax=Streptomyces oceani TaxID=1075402 RepID=A0A1E7KH59_9ACTN|nr:LacI family DNA-binding transcriptional regulator [Streptomyces oceani]OEV03278.1 LacI family transcriptional regulator [Streptomyces oceani]
MASARQHTGQAADPSTPARPTGRDVARHAGVSQATVSLVLGGKWQGRVSSRTAETVRAAAEDLRYRPNLAARHLRLGRTRTALLVVPALSNDFFSRVHAGAARVAREHDLGLVLYPSPEGIAPAPDPFESTPATLDGVIASSMAPEALAALHGDLPLVMLDSDPAGTRAAATVNPDIADGMRRVAEHLLALGHRRIAHVSASVGSWTFHHRARALAQALAGTSASLVCTERSALTVAGGLRAATRALATDPRPSALVCDDDLLAAGACKAARRHGYRIPQDVSVTGFDDLDLATALEPELTTVRLPAEEVGATGMRALIGVLEGRQPDTALLPVALARRGSTGPAAGQRSPGAETG